MTAELKNMIAGDIAGTGQRRTLPSVSAGFALGLLRVAEARGAARTALLNAAGIAPELLADPDNRLPFSAYKALMRGAKTLTGDAALALHYGESVDIADVSIVGLIGQSCPTLSDAFVQLNRYVRLIVDVDIGQAQRFQMRAERGGVWMVDTRDDPNDFPELTESAFAQIITRGRRIVPDFAVKAVHVSHADPGYADEYERVLGAPVTFASDWNAVEVEPAFMTRKVEILPGYVFSVLCDRADALLAALEADATMRGRVERVLLPGLHRGDIAMPTVAAELGLSRQTLFRRLKAEGTSFEAVLDALRRTMALRYLEARKVSVNETAYLVGFSDPAAFSRAFKRWTGESPRAWRAARAG